MKQMLVQDRWSVRSSIYFFIFYKIITNFTFFIEVHFKICTCLNQYFCFWQIILFSHKYPFILCQNVNIFATSGRLTRSEHREQLKGPFQGENTGANCKYSPTLNWPEHALTNAALKMTTKILITFLIQKAGREEKGNKKEGTGESRTAAPAQPTTRLDGM